MPLIQTIQTLWSNCTVPLIDGLLFGGGNYLELTYDLIHLDRGKFAFRCDRSEYRDVANFLEDLSWVAVVDSFSSYRVDRGLVTVGDGTQGGDGFIALENNESQLEWLLFLQRSNPFVAVSVVDEIVIATSELGYDLKIPLDHPESAFLTG